MAEGAAGRRRVRRRVVAGLGGLVLLAALVTVALEPVDGRAADAGPLSTAPALLTDRGAAATIAALRELDACRLAEPGGSDEGRDGPHVCKGIRGGAVITVTVGGSYDRRNRWYDRPIVVAGVRAYRSTSVDRRSMCSVAIPVSFRYAVEFEASRIDDDDACPSAEQAAASAVPLLRAPPQQPDPTTVPLTDRDPCAVVAATGLYDEAALHLETDPGELDPGIDRCTVPVGRDEIGVRLDYGEAEDPTSRCMRDVALPRRGTGPRTRLTVTWNGDDCAPAEALAARLPGAFSSARPPRPATRPVRLFAPDEPDSPVTGPCADLVFDECREPSGSVAALQGVDILLAASQADPSHTCSLAAGAVGRVFGPSLRPVVYGDFCHFVDDRHEIDVGVAAGTRFDLSDYDQGDPNRHDVVVAGHEAHYTETASSTDRVYGWTVRPRPGPPDPVADAAPGRGVLTVAVTHGPPRGEALGPGTMPGDPAVRAQAEQLVGTLLTEHFG